ncbi:MAG: sulfite exporter TauE/SafE family protein [Thermoplasmata archaeon]|nr:sulfite exporter TauE/SafE family protein [Thermoplasmata archaeon]MCI4359402.1 sulfite exporter TauE/SafE family protein [Thermoplasmata archaeon]
MVSFDAIGGSSPLFDLALLLIVSFAAGAIGALMGVGGGLFLVPALILLFGLDVHVAIAASLVSVVATTTGATAARMGEGFVNLRLGMFLETATVVGGLVGALISVTLLSGHGNLLILALIPVILLAAVLMSMGRTRSGTKTRSPDPLADRLRLGGEYVDPSSGEREVYRVRGTTYGLGFASLAGLASGLLGVGGGIFKVPAMNAFMNVPLRVASATSTLMIGVTASAGALVYLFAGDVALTLVAPVAVAVLLGSYLSTHWGSTWTRQRLRFVFVGILVLAALLLLLRGTGVLA